MAGSGGITVTIKATGFKELANALFQAPQVVGYEIYRALDKTGTFIIQRARSNILANNSTDTGGLASDITKNAKKGILDVSANSDYAINVEDGRKAGSRMPPKDVLLPWMARHGIPEEAEYAIRKHIAVHGIKPKPFMAPALVAADRVMDKEFDAAMQRIINRVFG